MVIDNAGRKLLISYVLIETGSWFLNLICLWKYITYAMGYVLLQVVNMNLSIDITNNYFSVNIICDFLPMA
jgi:hypothetical protein